jgi:hypothetical protein
MWQFYVLAHRLCRENQESEIEAIVLRGLPQSAEWFVYEGVLPFQTLS